MSESNPIRIKYVIVEIIVKKPKNIKEKVKKDIKTSIEAINSSGAGLDTFVSLDNKEKTKSKIYIIFKDSYVVRKNLSNRGFIYHY